MAEFRIRAGIQGLPAVRQAIYAQVFPLLTEAVGKVSQQVAINWMESIRDARGLWVGERDAYANSVQVKMTGAYSALVWSDYKFAHDIEVGRPPRDLKKMLDTSLKVRRTKSGKRFLIIPFRHNTPGHDATGPSMPEHVYQQARTLAPSTVTGMGERRAGQTVGFGMQPIGDPTPFASDIKTKQHLMVPQRQYKWGGRLAPGAMGPNPKGKVDRFAGMVRFDAAKPKGAQYSTYLTFRVMSESSHGWIIPAKPGLHIAKKVADDMQPVAEAIFKEAVTRSL